MAKLFTIIISETEREVIGQALSNYIYRNSRNPAATETTIAAARIASGIRSRLIEAKPVVSLGLDAEDEAACMAEYAASMRAEA